MESKKEIRYEIYNWNVFDEKIFRGDKKIDVKDYNKFLNGNFEMNDSHWIICDNLL